MRDEIEGIVASLADRSEALRAAASDADEPLAELLARSTGTSRDELPTAIAKAREAAAGSSSAAGDLHEAAQALQTYLDRVL